MCRMHGPVVRCVWIFAAIRVQLRLECSRTIRLEQSGRRKLVRGRQLGRNRSAGRRGIDHQPDVWSLGDVHGDE